MTTRSNRAGTCAWALDWQALAAPGHDPHALLLWCEEEGILISGDALWQNGFGVVFPELAGEPGFHDVRATLDLIARHQRRPGGPAGAGARQSGRGARGRRYTPR